MTLRSSSILGLTALATLVALGAALPASADEPRSNFGPVGPSEPILAKIGTQRVIAFYKPEAGRCAVMAVVWGDLDAKVPYASTRIRIDLKPGEMLRLDAAEKQSMNLLCGADASTLAVVAPPELIRTGALNTD